MKTKVEINIYEISGEECTGIDSPKLKLESHWNRYREMVVLKFGKKEITVLVNDIIDAVKKCQRI